MHDRIVQPEVAGQVCTDRSRTYVQYDVVSKPKADVLDQSKIISVHACFLLNTLGRNCKY